MELAPSGRPTADILADAVAGRRISAGDPRAPPPPGRGAGRPPPPGAAHTLLLEGDLLELGLAAQQVRNRHNDPQVATYNVDRNINYTNVCVYRCRFCAFYRKPGEGAEAAS